MSTLISAIRFLKKEGMTYDYIVTNKDEVWIKLDLCGLGVVDSLFFESVVNAMKLA